MVGGRILVVDDDELIRLSLKVLLEEHFASIEGVGDPDLLPQVLKSGGFDLVVLDMNFHPGDSSGEEGLFWIRKIGELLPGIPVVVITAYADVYLAVKALQAGAADFVVKPWQNEKILATITAAYRLSQSRQEVSLLKDSRRTLNSFSGWQYEEMVGRSSAIRKVFETISKVAPTDANVLILGENGTGKELVAQAIHRLSNRSQEVFVAVDAGAIPETLFESELFGHKKGAFTDAKEDRVGRFEAASGGTIFLDELGNIPLSLQTKLLSVLQNRRVTRIGGHNPTEIDVRLVCATNMDLNRAVQEGSFRQDLLYRINTVEIVLPPLRERIEDIPLLVTHFLEIFCKKYGKPTLKAPDYVVKKLQKYHWPGNIRELKHAIERAVIMSDSDSLRSSEFLFSEASTPTGFPLDNLRLDELEKWAIAECLKKNQGNVTRAAQELGITRGALYRRIEQYGL